MIRVHYRPPYFSSIRAATVKGANIRVVQELLGHENLATTQVYLSVTDQGLRQAVKLLDNRRSNKAQDRVRVGDKTYRVVTWPTVKDVYIPKPIR